MKPLARWTLGPVSRTGFEILYESLRLFVYNYPEFERVICYNHLDPSDVAQFRRFGELYEQKEEEAPCLLHVPDNNPEAASGCGWKLCPSRLNPDGCELWIDNDLVLRERIPQIETWLQFGGGIVCEGLHRRRMFGAFDSIIPPDVHACAGLFGLPGSLDFASRINELIYLMEGKPLGGYDEQGLSVAVVVRMPHYQVIPLDVMYISEDHVSFPSALPQGIHFVAANRKPWHRGWKAYKRMTTPLI